MITTCRLTTAPPVLNEARWVVGSASGQPGNGLDPLTIPALEPTAATDDGGRVRRAMLSRGRE